MCSALFFFEMVKGFSYIHFAGAYWKRPAPTGGETLEWLGSRMMYDFSAWLPNKSHIVGLLWTWISNFSPRILENEDRWYGASEHIHISRCQSYPCVDHGHADLWLYVSAASPSGSPASFSRCLHCGVTSDQCTQIHSVWFAHLYQWLYFYIYG